MRVHDGNGADGESIGSHHGRPSVETNSRVTGDESETRESLVRGGIGYHQGFGAADGVCAEGRRASELDLLEAVGGLEPASIMGDEADCGHGCAEELGRQARDTVEMGIGRRIEDAAALQSGEAQAFGQSRHNCTCGRDDRRGSGTGQRSWRSLQWDHNTDRSRYRSCLSYLENRRGETPQAQGLTQDQGAPRPASMIVPKTQWNLDPGYTFGPVVTTW